MQRRVALVVAASLIPAMLLATAMLGYDYYVKEREREERDSLATVRAMAARTEAELRGITAALFALGTSPYLETGDLARFHRQASAALENQRFTNIVLFDDALRPQLNTLLPFGAAMPAQSGATLLSRVLETGKPTVTDLFTGRGSGQALIGVGVPVTRSDGRRFVLGAGVAPQRLAGILAEQQLPPGWIGAIFDRSGTIAARTHDAARFVGQKGAPELLRQMAGAPEGTVETRSLEGIPVVSVFSRSPVSGWTVAIGIPTEYFDTHLLYSLARFVLVAFVMLAAAIALALALVKRLAG